MLPSADCLVVSDCCWPRRRIASTSRGGWGEYICKTQKNICKKRRHLVSDDHVAHAAHHAVAVVTIGGPVTPGPGHRPDGDAADTAVTLHTKIF